MSSSALRIIAILLAIGALVLGYMGYQASQAPVATTADTAAEAPTPEPVKFPVLVAARDIPISQPLNENDVTTIFIEKQPADSYSEQQQVLDRQPRVAIAAGDLILKDHFYDFSNIVAAIRPGERAIAVRVDEVTGVGGFIQPGDYVDVLLYLAAGNEVGKDSSAQRILSAARVLAYGNTVDKTDDKAITDKAKVNNNQTNNAENNDADTEEAPEPSGKQSKTAVLAVAEENISALLLAESAGRLRLALLGPEALVDNTSTAKEETEAELKTAQKSQRQPVTLEEFKVSPEQAFVEPRAVSKQRAVAPPPPKPTITVHRGISENSVNVDREN